MMNENHKHSKALESIKCDNDNNIENTRDQDNNNDVHTKLLKQNVKPTIKTPLKTLKPLIVKQNKRVLNTLDTIISLFIVTPCVVGCWRGVWNLMDIYMHLFPPWESCVVGVVAHVIFALAQDIFQHVFVVKRKKYGYFSSFIFSKSYTWIFCVVSNLQWRGGWNIYDYYLGVKIETARAVLEDGYGTAMICLICCIMCLVVLKCMRNTMAAPIAIGVDIREELFLFPTRFKIKAEILYFSLSMSKTSNESLVSEKLLSQETIIHDEIRMPAPRPFGTNVNGLIPQEFATTTEKTTTVNYPQLTNYRNRYYPQNIQDIIGYVTKTKNKKRNENKNVQKEKQFGASNQERFKENITISSVGSAFSNNDPFYSYKPQDPGDINLLATASFRFAPPIWSNIRNSYPKVYSHPNVQQVENSNVQETYNKLPRPIVLTLNIYPMDNEVPLIPAYHRYGQMPFPYRFQNAESRSRIIGGKGSRMTVHLNVYPEPGANTQQNIENGRILKNIFKQMY